MTAQALTATPPARRAFPGEDGYFVATCDEPPGCVSQGKTIEDVRANIKEAMDAYLETWSQLSEL